MIRLLLLILLLPSLAFSTERFVRCATGSDAGTGADFANAYLTVQKCIDVSTRSDQCTISDNEPCTPAAAWDFTTGYTDAGTGYFEIRGGDDGGSQVVAFPDNRPDIADVAYIDFSGLSVIAFQTPSYVKFSNLKISASDVNSALRFGEFFINEDLEFNDVGIASRTRLVEGNSQYGAFNNVFWNRTTGTSNIFYDHGGWQYGTMSNCYFQINNFSGQLIQMRFANFLRQHFRGNVFEITGGTGNILEVDFGAVVEHNTFLGNSVAGITAIKTQPIVSNIGFISSITNNVFYEFDGAGSKSLELASADAVIVQVGSNGFFNSAATVSSSPIILIDLTSEDTTAAADPFTDLAGGDLSLIEAYQKTGYLYKADTVDIGQVQTITGAGCGLSCGGIQYLSTP